MYLNNLPRHFFTILLIITDYGTDNNVVLVKDSKLTDITDE